MLDGWDGLEAIGREQATPDPAAPDEVDLVDKLYVDVFNTPAGYKLLSHWRAKKLDAAVCVPGAGADAAYLREGENTLIRECIQRLKRGTTPKT